MRRFKNLPTLVAVSPLFLVLCFNGTSNANGFGGFKGPKITDIGKWIDGGKKVGEEISKRWKDLVKDTPKAWDEFLATMEGRDDDTCKNANVICFQHIDGRGKARGFRVGDQVNLTDVHYSRGHGASWKEWNDEVSSLVVLDKGVTVELYEHTNCGGRTLNFTGPCRINLTDHNFNDKASTVRVVRQ